MSNKNPRNEQTLYNGHAMTARYPMPFDKAFPGSFFFIRSEPSRGLRYSNDKTLYRKGREEEGFYAVDAETETRAVCLMPEDLVVTVRQHKQNA